MINAHHLLRLMRRSRSDVRRFLDRFVLLRAHGRLWVRDPRSSFDVPSWGAWPAPISVSAIPFIQVVRELSEDYIWLMYDRGKLVVCGVELEAEEL